MTARLTENLDAAFVCEKPDRVLYILFTGPQVSQSIGTRKTRSATAFRHFMEQESMEPRQKDFLLGFAVTH
jgi:hypothetical protein